MLIEEIKSFLIKVVNYGNRIYLNPLQCADGVRFSASQNILIYISLLLTSVVCLFGLPVVISGVLLTHPNSMLNIVMRVVFANVCFFVITSVITFVPNYPLIASLLNQNLCLDSVLSGIS